MVSIKKCLFPLFACAGRLTAADRYPNDINPATAVPAWAYIDVVTPDEFDPVRAMQVRLPESTVGNNDASASSSPSPSATPVQSASNQPSNTPAIIGGAVGGVLGLGLILALIIYLLKQDDTRKHRRQPPSAAFARAAATPDVAAAAGFRSASRQANPLGPPFMSGTSVGHGGSSHGHGHGHRGASPVFQLGYANGTPWSPPPPSSTPTGAVSPMSAQSLLMTQNYGGGGGGIHGSNSFDYPNSSVGHGTVDLLGHSGSMSSMRCVPFHATHVDVVVDAHSLTAPV